MKHKLIFTALVILLIFSPKTSVFGNEIEYSISTPLCLPFIASYLHENCTPSGSTEYLTTMSNQGMQFPLVELPARNVPKELGDLPFYYVGLNQSRPIPMYPSAGDALSNTNAYRAIETGFNYATFTDFLVDNNDKTYMINPGVWINGKDTTGRVVGPSFSGLLFAGTPKNEFGWMIFTSESKRTPGYGKSDFNGDSLTRYDLVQVYDTQIVDGARWHLIGPDKWVDSRYTALIYPVTSPPDGVDTDRWIEINLFEQTVSVYEDNHLVFATLVSSGLPGWWTRPGLFNITQKDESTLMTGAFEADRSDYYFLQDVPYAMYFDESRAFHGAYWHNSFGYQRSHGCANLSPADSHWLFDWADEGDYVYVWDASGNTPEDPSLYGAGGA